MTWKATLSSCQPHSATHETEIPLFQSPNLNNFYLDVCKVPSHEVFLTHDDRTTPALAFPIDDLASRLNLDSLLTVLKFGSMAWFTVT